MIMRKTLFLFFIFVCLSGRLGAQVERLTLTQVKALATEQSETIRMQKASVRQAERAVDGVSATRLPKVDFTASYNYVSDVAKIDLAVPNFFSKSISFGDGKIYDLSLSASVPLFTGFRLSSAIDLQKQNGEIAQQTLAGNMTEVRNAVAQYFHVAELALKQSAVLQQQEKLLAQNLAMRRALFNEGQALAFDTLQLSTRISQIRVDQAGAEAQYRNAVLLLMQFTGRTASFDIIPEGPAHSELENRSVEELTDRACAQRYELKNITSSRRINELSKQSLQAAYYPSVFAMAAYRYGRPGVDQIKNEWMDYYTAGLKLEWNLWSWGSDKNAIEKQELEIEKTDLREQQVKRQIRTQIAVLLNELDVRRKTLAFLDEQIRQEQLKQTLAQSRLTEGLATVTEVVDAETSLTTALLRKEQTQIEYTMKLAELAAAVGTEL
jgi:outer membrane protein